MKNKIAPHSYWYVLSICMIAPAIADLVRKLLPNQPNYMVTLFSGIALLCAGGWALSIKKKLPTKIRELLLYWVLFLTIFIVFAAFVDWRVGIAGLVLRILPVGMVFIAYKAINSIDDFERFAFVLAWIPIILAPVGVIVLIQGNQVLPDFLRPIKRMILEGRDYRGGFDTCCTTFATAAIMANSLSALFYTSIAAATLRNKNLLFYFISIFCSLFLIYLSARRGDLYITIAAVPLYFYMYKKNRIKTFFAILIGTIAFIIVDQHSFAAQTYAYSKRHELMISNSKEVDERFNEIFLGSIRFWLREGPFGSFVGFGGNEGSAFGKMTTASIETGGAQLIAETGIIGLILMPTLLITMWVRLWRDSMKAPYKNSIQFLIFGDIGLYILWFFKVTSAVSNLYIAHLFFWAVPGLCLALVKIGKESPDRTSLIKPSDNPIYHFQKLPNNN